MRYGALWVASIAFLASNLAASPQVTERIGTTDGVVQVITTSGSHRAQPGESLAKGSKVRTAARSSALLDLSSTDSVSLGEQTEVQVPVEAGGPVLSLESGSLKLLAQGPDVAVQTKFG